MAAALQRAELALRAGDGLSAVRDLEAAVASSDSAAVARAGHMLGAVLHGASGDSRVALDLSRSALGYAASVRAFARSAALRRSMPALFFDATHACKAAVTEREVAPASPAFEVVLLALQAVCSACKGEDASPDDIGAVVAAFFGRAQAAFSVQDRENAAKYYRRAVAVGPRLTARSDARAHELFHGAAENLAVFEARTAEEHAAARAVIRAVDPSRVDVNVYAQPVTTAERPRCTACGAQPLTLKRCGGTCGGAACYCDAACYAADVREHMRRDSCRKKSTPVS